MSPGASPIATCRSVSGSAPRFCSVIECSHGTALCCIAKQRRVSWRSSIESADTAVKLGNGTGLLYCETDDVEHRHRRNADAIEHLPLCSASRVVDCVRCMRLAKQDGLGSRVLVQL
jgi:hypothetical protein